MDKKKKVKKALTITLSTLIGIVILVILIGIIVYPPRYVYRYIFWGPTGIYDNQKFLHHEIQNEPPTFYFHKKIDEDFISAQFEEHYKSFGFENLDQYFIETDTTAFIVIKDDTILYEKYFNSFKENSLFLSFSVAKSFVSALIGIAIDEGYISSIYDSITDYIPELSDRDERFSQISLRDLLMMSSGIKRCTSPDFFGTFNFPWSDVTKAYYYPDVRKLILEDIVIEGNPGECFQYNDYNTQILGLILERATGTSVSEYLQEKIWEPLGMEYDAIWSIDSKEKEFEMMADGISARAIDYAKFGRLLLNNGNWEGKQIIPKEWVLESTQEDNSIEVEEYYPNYSEEWTSGCINQYYKYHWWGIKKCDGNYNFFARGFKGQYIYISPNKNTIIIRLGAEEEFPLFRPKTLSDFEDKL